MVKLFSYKQCPNCKSHSFRRESRKPWMRQLVFTKYYACKKCMCKFMITAQILVSYKRRKLAGYNQ